MQRRARRGVLLASVGLVGAAWLTPDGARAAGYYAGPIGSKAIGRGGAFVARADDLSAAFYNPAGLAKLTTPLQVHLENKAAYSSLTFARDPTRDGRSVSAPLVGFESSENARRSRPLGPLFGVASNFGLRDFTFALMSFTPSGAANTEFPVEGGQKYLLVKRDVVVINTSLSAAWRPQPNLAVGLSVQAISVPSINYQLVIDNAPGSGVDVYNPVSSALDMLTTIRASDPFTLNLTAGLWARPDDSFEVGFSAQLLPANIEAQGTLQVEPISAATLEILGNLEPPVTGDEAITLTRDGEQANDIRLKLPLPLTFRAGTRFIDRRPDGAERFDIEVNATYETWSRVDAFTMNGNGLEANFAALGAAPIPLSTLSVQKHWQDSLTLAVGSDVHPDGFPLTLRCGAYYETPVTPKEYAHVDFPGGAHVGLGAGFTLPLGPFALNLAYERRQMLAYHTAEAEGQVRQIKPNLGANPLPAADPPVVNAGTYTFGSHNLALSIEWKL
jgi:long-chain fatty acid transport protein